MACCRVSIRWTCLGALALALSSSASALADGAGSKPAEGACPPDMALVPTGTFQPHDRKKPAFVKEVCLDRTEVTVKAYAACVKSGACTEPGTERGCNWQQPDRENNPINCVDWPQARAFCDSLSRRLPTDEELEWAARGEERGWRYPWGDQTNGRRYCSDPGPHYGGQPFHADGTCPVGAFPKGDNPQGIHDLAGNVREWTLTLLDPEAPNQTKPFGQPKHAQSLERVCKGGAWSDNMEGLLEASFRPGRAPNTKHFDLGFRCAKSP